MLILQNLIENCKIADQFSIIYNKNNQDSFLHSNKLDFLTTVKHFDTGSDSGLVVLDLFLSSKKHLNVHNADIQLITINLYNNYSYVDIEKNALTTNIKTFFCVTFFTNKPDVFTYVEYIFQNDCLVHESKLACYGCSHYNSNGRIVFHYNPYKMDDKHD
ncbi:MAG: hypothetical protein QXH92_03845 [Candidatus Aenigmatarchaeota archaeon]